METEINKEEETETVNKTKKDEWDYYLGCNLERLNELSEQSRILSGVVPSPQNYLNAAVSRLTKKIFFPAEPNIETVEFVKKNFSDIPKTTLIHKNINDFRHRMSKIKRISKSDGETKKRNMEYAILIAREFMTRTKISPYEILNRKIATYRSIRSKSIVRTETKLTLYQLTMAHLICIFNILKKHIEENFIAKENKSQNEEENTQTESNLTQKIIEFIENF